MFLKEDKVNKPYDNYLKNCDIMVYSNKHGAGHLELRTANKSYFVFIPSVLEWKKYKNVKPLVTSTKPHLITSALECDLILWFDEKSNRNNINDYTNLEYCRYMWNFKNTNNISKNLAFFDLIEDVKKDENGNDIIPPNFMNIGNIKIEILEDSTSNNTLKFKYENLTYVLRKGTIYPISKFLQDLFDEYYK